MLGAGAVEKKFGSGSGSGSDVKKKYGSGSDQNLAAPAPQPCLSQTNFSHQSVIACTFHLCATQKTTQITDGATSLDLHSIPAPPFLWVQLSAQTH